MEFPVYGGQQVAPTITPEVDTRHIERRLPSATGEGLGASIQSAGEGMAQIYHDANFTRVEDTINSAVRPFQQSTIDNFLALKGKNALTDGKSTQALPDQVMGQFDAQMSKIRSGLSNPQQQKMFDQKVSRLRLETQGQVTVHFNQQMLDYQQDTNTSTIKTEQEHIGKIGFINGQLDNASVEQSVQRINTAVDAQARLLGWSLEHTQAAKLDSTTQAYTTVIGGMLLQNKPDAAQAYFQIHKDQIDSSVGAHIQKIIQADQLNQQINTAVDLVWLTKGPKLAGDPVDMETMANDLRNRLGNNPEGLKIAHALLKERRDDHEDAQKQQADALTGGIWQQVLNGAGIGTVTQSPEYKMLNGNTQHKLIAEIETFKKRNENDPATVVAQFATFQKLCDDPKSLVGMSDAQIASYTGTLGPQLTKQLMVEKRQALGDLGKLQKATLNDVKFNDIAAEYGLKTKGTMTQDDYAKLGQLRDAAMSAIRDEQEAKGSVVLPERKEELIRGLLTDVATKQKGDWFSHTNKLFQVNSFMDLDATDEEKTKALDYLTRANADTTPSNVWRMIQEIRKKRN